MEVKAGTVGLRRILREVTDSKDRPFFLRVLQKKKGGEQRNEAIADRGSRVKRRIFMRWEK